MVQEFLWLQNYMILSRIFNLFGIFSSKISFEELIFFFENSKDLKKKFDRLKLFLSSAYFSKYEIQNLTFHIENYLNSSKSFELQKSFWINKIEIFKESKSIEIIFKCYQILIFLGLYETALIYRNLYVERCLLSDNEINKVRSQFELGLVSNFSKIKHRKFNILFHAYSKLIEKKNFIEFYNNLNHLHETKEHDFFYNKKILIIGPLSKTNNYHDYDTIIFIKSQPKKTLKKLTTKNVIIYFNSHNIRNKNFHNFYNDNYDEVNLFKVKESVGLSKTSSINKNPYLLSGGPMMLQNILFDIMIYNPNKIFISGFNFYCSKKMYNDSYQSLRWYDDIFFVRKSFALHDLISNFQFVKNMFDINLLSVDELGSEILKLSVKDYIIRIKKYY